MIEEQPLILVTVANLLDEAKKYFEGNYRLIQIGCTKTSEVFEINYSFSKDMSFVNLRLNIKDCLEVPSISGIYLCAFIYENELADLYGVKIKGIAIDYQGKFYRTVEKNAFATCPIKEVKVATMQVKAEVPVAPVVAKVEIKAERNNK